MVKDGIYTSSQVYYDENDANQVAIANLLSLFDFDSDSKLDYFLNTQEIDFKVTQIQGIPYTWSTEVQIRSWY